MTLARQDLRDFDLVWLATDSAGRLAAFVTGGAGPVPDAALPFIENAEQLVLAQPEVSGYEVLFDDGDYSSFANLAKRGLFVYDWRDVHRTNAKSSNLYELVVTPTEPMHLSAADPYVRLSAASVLLDASALGSPTIKVDVVV